MTRKPMVTHQVMVPAEMLARMRPRCAWKGCESSLPAGGVPLPPGWRWMCLWAGTAGLPPWAEGNIWDRDAVLCPKHARMLHHDLLSPIPERMDKTEGSA